VKKGLGVTRKIASGYLAALEEYRIFTSQKIGKKKVFLNQKLLAIVKESGESRLKVDNKGKCFFVDIDVCLTCIVKNMYNF
jgi:hypothetical protein